MRILAIGVPLHHREVTNDDYASPRSLLDFDAVIWDPSGFPFEYEAEPAVPTYRGARCLSEEASALIGRDMKRRSRELRQFVAAGRVLAVVVPPPTIFYRATGQSELASAARGQQARRIVEPISILSALPVPGLETVEGEGSSIDFRGDGPFRDYWHAVGRFHRYVASVPKSPGKPFAFVHGTDEAVAAAVPTERGTILLLPRLVRPAELGRGGDYRRVTSLFVDALMSLSQELQRTSGDFALPSWAKRVLLPGEASLGSEAVRREHVLKAASNALSEVKQRQLALESWKVLLAGSGVALEKAVRAALDGLGFSCTPFEPSRTDISARFGESPVVVEVQGVARGAAEKHAAQLEKSASEYLAEHEQRPKALLVVNAWCEAPLYERKDAFPAPMRRYAESREHCLCTTTQLLGLYLATLQAPERRDELVRDLLDTVGVYPRFADASQFLTLPGVRPSDGKTLH
jgi:hypothetical protein